MGLCKKICVSLAVLIVALFVAPFLIRENLFVWSVLNPLSLDNSTYDYIVVGSGPAGCVAGTNLALQGGFRTLVIEQGGPDYLSLVADPIRYPSGFIEIRNTSLVRIVGTVEQEGLDGRSVELTQPFVAGGGGSVGWSLFLRGSDALFNAWAELGCPRWRWQEMTTFWKMANRATDVAPAFVSDVARSILTGAAMSGFSTYGAPKLWLPDMIEGFGVLQTTAHVDERSSPLELLRWALRSDRLSLSLNSKVKRVIFDGNTAKGVEFEYKGQTVRVYANEEVILSAGTVGTPDILVHSGIGPSQVLDTLGINVVHELEGVGSHLQDHVLVPIGHNLNQPGTSIHSMQGRNQRLTYSLFGEGLVGSNLLEVGGLTRSSDEKEIYDLMLIGGPLWFVNPSYSPPETATSTKDGATLLAALTQPQSEGELIWESIDQSPRINPNYLTSPADMKALLHGVKLARQVMANAEDDLIGDEELPGMLVQSDEELQDYIKKSAMAGHSFSGTCKMGAKSDPLAVVDDKLRVYGVKRLRVADLSVCPTSPNGGGLATATIIGAKVADVIIEQELSPGDF